MSDGDDNTLNPQPKYSESLDAMKSLNISGIKSLPKS